MVVKAGDKVRFTGHGYRRAIEFKYEEIFGGKELTIKDVRTSCCNTFIVLHEVEGMYSSKFFSKV